MARRDSVARGTRAERIAAAALRASGYRLLAQRWRIPGGEIDLIAEDAEGYAFVEVKARRGYAIDAAATAVTPRKLAFLHRAAQQWLLATIGDREVAWRIDVVAIALDAADRPTRIEIIRYFEG